MNAKQIADELENIYWIQGDGKGKPFQQYADFIRQQQAEIEALNRKLTAYKQSNSVADTQIKALQNLVEEQDKKIVELAFRAVYAERGNEVAKELSK